MRRWPRWLAEPFRRQMWPLLWPAAAVVGITAEWQLYGWADPAGWAPDLLTGWTMIGCGLAGCSRRPQSRSGALLAAAGFAWFAPNYAVTGVAAIAWLSAHALYLYRGPLVQLVLTYPRGRPVRRLDRAALAAGYAVAVLTPVWADGTATIVLACVLVTVAIRGYLCAAGRERRMRLAALWATTVLTSVLAAIALVRLAVPGQAADAATLHAYQAVLCGLSLGLLVGLLRGPWERAELADLVVELGETRSGTLRDQLARALGDPSLEVGYWVAQSAGFVDSGGRPVPVPDPGSGRSMTMVEREGQPLAVLVHDPAAQLPLRRQLRPQHRELGVLRLDHSPQPGQQLTLLPGTSRQIRRIGHKRRSCSTSTTGSSSSHVVSRRPHPREWTPVRRGRASEPPAP